MPPRKIAPVVEVESFTVKKRAYVRKKKVEAETEIEVQPPSPSPPIAEMRSLSLEEEEKEPVNKKIQMMPELKPSLPLESEGKGKGTESLSMIVPWVNMNWEEELGPSGSYLYITCKVAIPFVGKNMINLQFYTESAMNPMGSYCLPHAIYTTSSPPPPLPTPQEGDSTESFYASALHERVIVRYEIYRREADLTWRLHPEKPKGKPGYHGSVFLMRDLVKDQIFDPKCVIRYKDHYVQLPRLMLQGVVRF